MVSLWGECWLAMGGGREGRTAPRRVMGNLDPERLGVITEREQHSHVHIKNLVRRRFLHSNRVHSSPGTQGDNSLSGTAQDPHEAPTRQRHGHPAVDNSASTASTAATPTRHSGSACAYWGSLLSRPPRLCWTTMRSARFGGR